MMRKNEKKTLEKVQFYVRRTYTHSSKIMNYTCTVNEANNDYLSRLKINET